MLAAVAHALYSDGEAAEAEQVADPSVVASVQVL